MTTCEHGTDGCLMAAPHLESECHTYEMMRRQEEAMGFAGAEPPDNSKSEVDLLLDMAKRRDLTAVIVVGLSAGGEGFITGHLEDIEQVEPITRNFERQIRRFLADDERQIWRFLANDERQIWRFLANDALTKVKREKP